MNDNTISFIFNMMIINLWFIVGIFQIVSVQSFWIGLFGFLFGIKIMDNKGALYPNEKRKDEVEE